METHLYINTTPDPDTEVNPAELLEVEALVAEAHAYEPIRKESDLCHLGRFVAMTGKSQGKNYGQEWPVAKARAIARYLLPAPMSLASSSL